MQASIAYLNNFIMTPTSAKTCRRSANEAWDCSAERRWEAAGTQWIQLRHRHTIDFESNDLLTDAIRLSCAEKDNVLNAAGMPQGVEGQMEFLLHVIEDAEAVVHRPSSPNNGDNWTSNQSFEAVDLEPTPIGPGATFLSFPTIHQLSFTRDCGPPPPSVIDDTPSLIRSSSSSPPADMKDDGGRMVWWDDNDEVEHDCYPQKQILGGDHKRRRLDENNKKGLLEYSSIPVRFFHKLSSSAFMSDDSYSEDDEIIGALPPHSFGLHAASDDLMARSSERSAGGVQVVSPGGAISKGRKVRYRVSQVDQWLEKFEELLLFKAKMGHCLVPHTFPENPKLAQWVKRQRYQYKLKTSGQRSSLSEDRLMQLESVGFVWHSHQAAWCEKIHDLKVYRAQYGNCRVPPRYHDRSLAVWVKCQRRQWKLHQRGEPCTLDDERIAELDSMNFEWNPRGL